MTMTEVVKHSSNLGAGVLAHVIGSEERQKAFLKRFGLASRLDTPDVKAAAPLLPKHWGVTETVTIGYGHGIAVAPLHFAVAVRTAGQWRAPRSCRPICSAATFRSSPAIRSSARRPAPPFAPCSAQNVLSGTGRRADVPGYNVGGKTGTADIARRGGYDGKAVISSFAAAFPIRSSRAMSS